MLMFIITENIYDNLLPLDGLLNLIISNPDRENQTDSYRGHREQKSPFSSYIIKVMH